MTEKTTTGRLLVVGDIHGAARALKQVLERAEFARDVDRLVCLGDVCDGWPETYEVIKTLLTIPDLILLIGNHDEWFLDWITSGMCVHEWYSQGGAATIASYGWDVRSWEEACEIHSPNRVPPEHQALLRSAKMYHVEDGIAFVHGGFMPRHPVEMLPPGGWTWDRHLWSYAGGHAQQKHVTPYKRVFIGHTATKQDTPQRRADVWNLDQGCGWDGKLTLMDAYSLNYWQSDSSRELYPGIRGR